MFRTPSTANSHSRGPFKTTTLFSAALSAVAQAATAWPAAILLTSDCVGRLERLRGLVAQGTPEGDAAAVAVAFSGTSARGCGSDALYDGPATLKSTVAMGMRHDQPVSEWTTKRSQYIKLDGSEAWLTVSTPALARLRSAIGPVQARGFGLDGSFVLGEAREVPPRTDRAVIIGDQPHVGQKNR